MTGTAEARDPWDLALGLAVAVVGQQIAYWRGARLRRNCMRALSSAASEFLDRPLMLNEQMTRSLISGGAIGVRSLAEASRVGRLAAELPYPGDGLALQQSLGVRKTFFVNEAGRCVADVSSGTRGLVDDIANECEAAATAAATLASSGQDVMDALSNDPEARREARAKLASPYATLGAALERAAAAASKLEEEGDRTRAHALHAERVAAVEEKRARLQRSREMTADAGEDLLRAGMRTKWLERSSLLDRLWDVDLRLIGDMPDFQFDEVDAGLPWTDSVAQLDAARSDFVRGSGPSENMPREVIVVVRRIINERVDRAMNAMRELAAGYDALAAATSDSDEAPAIAQLARERIAKANRSFHAAVDGLVADVDELRRLAGRPRATLPTRDEASLGRPAG